MHRHSYNSSATPTHSRKQLCQSPVAAESMLTDEERSITDSPTPMFTMDEIPRPRSAAATLPLEKLEKKSSEMPVLYRYEPYNSLCPVTLVGRNTLRRASAATQALSRRFLPQGTLRQSLFGKVSFFPFPADLRTDEKIYSPAPPMEERGDLVQLFFGQMPFRVSDAVIQWLVETLAESEVRFVERVIQEKARTGCLQLFVAPEDVDFILAGINLRVLFDATGVWYAQNQAEVEVLVEHCKEARSEGLYRGLPFNPVVAEISKSTFVRKPTRRDRRVAAINDSPPQVSMEPCLPEFCDCPDCMFAPSAVSCPPNPYWPRYPPPPQYSHPFDHDEEEFANFSFTH